MHRWIRRARLLLAWLLALYLARMYVQMGWVKFDPNGFWTAAFTRWGYPPWFRIFIGALEVLGGILIIVPYTASYGALVLSLVMLGAWGTRAHDARWVDVTWISVYLASLLWIGYEWWQFRLRFPRSRTSRSLKV